MYYDENNTMVIVCLPNFPLGRLPETVNMSNNCRSTTWVDPRSINEFGEGDVFIASASEDDQADIMSWIQNTIGYFTRVQAA